MSKCWYCNEELTSANYCEDHMGICNKCYSEMFKVSNEFVKGLTDKIADLEAKLAESEKENKTLKDIRTLERVVPRNTQLHKLSNRDCYLKGFENAISETIRTFEETYGKEKCKLVEERDKYLMDIVKAGGYECQIEELKQQLAEKDKQILELQEQSIRDNQIYNEELAEKEKEIEQLYEIIDCMDKIKEIVKEEQYKIEFAVEQLEKVKEKVICGVMDISNNYWSCFVKDGSQYMTSEDLYDALEQEFIHQIEELKKENKWQGS